MAKEIKINSEEELRPKMAQALEVAKEAAKSGPFIVRFMKPDRSREQEKKFHAMINDFAKQITFYGNKHYPLEIWKAKFVEQFAEEKADMGEPLRNPGQTTMSLDGKRVISVRPSTKDFSKGEAGEFIEYLYQQGAEMGIQWSEPAMKAYQEYKEANL